MNSIVKIILSFIPLILVGSWLIYRDMQSQNSLLKKLGGGPEKLRVGEKTYIARKKSRIMAIEKSTGKEAVVSTCGFEDGQTQLDDDLKHLPEGVKVRYRLKNGVFSPEDSDWLAGDSFTFLGVRQVEEYEEV